MNFSALENINDFVLNESLINESTEVISNIAFNAEPASGGWFGLIVLFAIYISTLYLLHRDDSSFRLPLHKASLYSSFFCIGIGSLMFVAGITTDFRHLMWFAIVFVISLMSVWISNQQ